MNAPDPSPHGADSNNPSDSELPPDAQTSPPEPAPTQEPTPTPTEGDTPSEGSGPIEIVEALDDAVPAEDEAKTAAAAPTKPKAKKKKKPKRRPPPVRAPEPPPCPPEFKEEAGAAARRVWLSKVKADKPTAEMALELLLSGRSVPYLARFRRVDTGGMDEQRLVFLRDAYRDLLEREERRIGVRELLKQRGGWNDEVEKLLAKTHTPSEMEDFAAPYMPVRASRAFMARSLGLAGLSNAIRQATEAQPLSELAQPFVKEGAEPSSLDAALGGARDIIAEEASLHVGLRRNLRDLFRKQARVSITARSEKRAPDQATPPKAKARAQSLVGFVELASKVPPMKMLAIRRAEKDRTIFTTIEPPEDAAMTLVGEAVVPPEHPYAGFLRAAAEDGYRRMLKPLLQNEARLELKAKADRLVMEGYERNLRHALLGPFAGPVTTLGIRPDVMQGHRWCAVDADGLPTGSGQLPHAPTAGRDACLAELKDVLKTYNIQAAAIGTSGGRADAVGLVRDAAKERPVKIYEVSDGGTRAIEGMGKLELDERPVIPAEARGALSLARRFQDPMAELVHIDPKALALGPHMHDVHQGHLRQMLDDVIESCVAYVGVDPNEASEDLIARIPGFTRNAAKAFVVWRTHNGGLASKAALAAIDGVGPEIAEQAVGFLRIPHADDPRDHTQLHPKDYDIVQQMADQVNADVASLFADSSLRQKVNLASMASDEMPLPLLRGVLYQAAVGDRDPRPPVTEPIPPPPGITLETLQPGLTLQGRVVRAAPFGVFVDVGLGIEGLVPVAHIGDHPGVEPATVAPIGSIIIAHVIESDPKKKRLTLSMRAERPPMHGGPRGPGGPRGRSDGPRGGGRPDRRPGGGREPVGAGSGGRGGDRGGERRGFGATPRGQGGPGGRGDGPRSGETRGQGRPSGGRGEGRAPGGRPSGTGGRPSGAGGRGQGGRPSASGGRSQGGRPGGRDGGSRGRQGGGGGGGFGRDRAPRKISLGPGPADKEAEIVDESLLSPEELMARKLAQLQQKLQRPD